MNLLENGSKHALCGTGTRIDPLLIHRRVIKWLWHSLLGVAEALTNQKSVNFEVSTARVRVYGWRDSSFSSTFCTLSTGSYHRWVTVS